MTSQAQNQLLQSMETYFDGLSKITLASQAILLKEMAENLDGNDLPAVEDALGTLRTDILMGAAAALAAAAGALEALGAGSGVDQGAGKYEEALKRRAQQATGAANLEA